MRQRWFLSVLVAILATPVLAVPIEGTFTATRSCPAYVSKNKQTNPDSVQSVSGTIYPLLEANQAVNPTWYRVRIQGVQPPERWIDVQCGTVSTGNRSTRAPGSTPIVGNRSTSTPSSTTITAGSTPSAGNGDCHKAGLADGYVLAVSWQPAFCEVRHGTPECNAMTPQAWAAHNFTLHGLWPNRAQCGTEYDFCGQASGPRAFCTYPSLPISPPVEQALEQVMPSAAAGSCLQRYEWYKHGTCQTTWNVDTYFTLATTLTRQFNEAGICAFVTRSTGATVATQDFLKEIDRVLGAGAHERMKLTCHDGNLTDIFIALPATLPTTAPSLRTLIQQAKSDFRSNCGTTFRVDSVDQK